MNLSISMKRMYPGILRASLLAAILLTFANPDAGAAEGSSRGAKKFGITAGALTSPYPTIWSFNANYNFESWIRAHADYGQFNFSSVSSSTFGVGARLFVPNWNFSPFVDIAYSTLNANATVNIQGSNVTLGGGVSILYSAFGLEWQTGYGLAVGAGYTLPLGGIFSGIGLPGIYLGWFF